MSCSLQRVFVVVQSLSHVRLFATPRAAACQASLAFTISRSLLKFMSFESAMPSNHLVHCHPLILLPSIFPRFSIFSNELALHSRWPKDWSFSISPSNEKSTESGRHIIHKALLEFYKARYPINVSERFCRKEICWTLSSFPMLISTTEFFFEGIAIQLV